MGRPLNSKFFGPDDSREASLTIDTTGDAVTAVTIVDGGTGYTPSLSAQTFNLDNTASGSGGQIQYDTTADGAITNASVAAGGSGYTADTAGIAVDSADVPDPDSDSGFQILGTAWIPDSIAGAAEPVYINRQRSSRKFDVVSIANGDSGVCITADTGSPSEGELSIPVTPFGGGTEYARIITANRVRTFDNNSYKWGERNEDEAGEALPGTDT